MPRADSHCKNHHRKHQSLRLKSCRCQLFQQSVLHHVFCHDNYIYLFLPHPLSFFICCRSFFIQLFVILLASPPHIFLLLLFILFFILLFSSSFSSFSLFSSPLCLSFSPVFLYTQHGRRGLPTPHGIWMSAFLEPTTLFSFRLSFRLLLFLLAYRSAHSHESWPRQ